MKNFIIFMLVLSISNAFPVPGDIIGYDQQKGIPFISLSSLDIEHAIVLKRFNINNIPSAVNTDDEYYKNRDRIVYLSSDNKYTYKVWQKGYASTHLFLKAFRAGFYDDIAIISGLIYDEDCECRGYIMPYMIDRTYARNSWNSYGFQLERGRIGVRIFSDYEKQPVIYRELFDALVRTVEETKYFIIDFCPNNVAVNDKMGKAYIIDLEDAQPINNFSKKKIAKILFNYSPKDFIDKLTEFYKNCML